PDLNLIHYIIPLAKISMISGLNPLSIFFGNKRGRLKIENGKHLLLSFLRRDDAVKMSQPEFAKGLFHKMVLLAGQTSAQPSSNLFCLECTVSAFPNNEFGRLPKSFQLPSF
ncbi:hypothetical protein, partial [Neisseria sp. HMSC074B07]|uniref:hypothetical protein n=1 Tax=Neisseria sp. HMSC074B07 TaxID=1715205 RepID=UPI00143952FD